MNKDALKEMIKRIMQEMVDEVIEEKLQASARDTGLATKADRKQAVGQQARKFATKGFSATQFDPASQRDQDPKSAHLQMRQQRSRDALYGKHGQTGYTPQGLRKMTGPQGDMARAGFNQQTQDTRAGDARANAASLKAAGGGAVPPDVQKAAAKQAGGKVSFGRYFDSSGRYLGKTSGGKWVPAGPEGDKSALKENTGMIRLTHLLNESMIERRVNLVRVQTVLEKLYPELNETQTKKIMELCTEAHMVAAQLNTTRYVRTESSLMEWKLLAFALDSKLSELKEEVVKACETKKIDSTTVVKALETVLEY